MVDWQSLLGMERLKDSAAFWYGVGVRASSARMDLLKVEWEKQKKGFVLMLAGTLLLVFSLAFLLLLVSIAVLLYWWNSPQWAVACTFVLMAWGVLGMLGVALVLRARKHLAHPFALTRMVLAEDMEQLQQNL